MYLLGTLVMVLIAINLAANPRNWHWLTGPGSGNSEKAKSALPPRPAIVPQPNWQVEDDPLPPGGFRTPLPREAEASESPPVTSANPAQDASPDEPPSAVPLDPELLATIRDDTLNIRSSEREAYLALLARARDLPHSQLEREAARDVSYSQIISDPDLYRGKLVTLEGDLRRLVDVGGLGSAPGDDTHGIQKVYEAWFFTADSGDAPYVFRCTSIPAGIPEGEKLSEKIRVTGYFFKRYQYPTVRGLYAAPMLLGKRLRWTPALVAPQTDPAVVPYILGGLTLVGTLLALIVWKFAAGENRQQRSNLKRVREPSREAIAALGSVEAIDIHTVLRELSEKAQREADETAGPPQA
jgi:hypothetical protein